jgi:hypothetical protein
MVTTYWLSRKPGQDAEGPFTLAQLRRMSAAGSVTAESQVCRRGESEWISLEDELALHEADQLAAAGPAVARSAPPMPEPPPRRRSRLGVLLILAGVLLVITAVFSRWAEREHGNPTGEAIGFETSLRRLLRGNLADPQAEMVQQSLHATVAGKCFRVVTVRGKNLLGGPIMQEFLVEGRTPADAAQMVPVRMFQTRWKTYLGLTPEQAQQVARELSIALE